jgi:hypothetical protein
MVVWTHFTFHAIKGVALNSSIGWLQKYCIYFLLQCSFFGLQVDRVSFDMELPAARKRKCRFLQIPLERGPRFLGTTDLTLVLVS